MQLTAAAAGRGTLQPAADQVSQVCCSCTCEGLRLCSTTLTPAQHGHDLCRLGLNTELMGGRSCKGGQAHCRGLAGWAAQGTVCRALGPSALPQKPGAKGMGLWCHACPASPVKRLGWAGRAARGARNLLEGLQRGRAPRAQPGEPILAVA